MWILDASINISMEPFRAFVGDKLPPSQRTSGFAMQSFFIGIGSVIAALLPWVFTNWFNMSNTAAAGKIPDSVKWSFYLGGLAFLGSVLFTSMIFFLTLICFHFLIFRLFLFSFKFLVAACSKTNDQVAYFIYN